MRFDPHVFRQQFPLFEQPQNSQLLYLDNAATTQRPAAVIEVIGYFYTHINANTHRSSHRLARAATEMVERTRAKAAAFVNAREARELVFCRGATEGLNLLAHSLCASLSPGDEILLTRAEHHANLIPWQLAAEQRGLTLRFMPDHQGRPQLERLHEALGERTRVVSITAASNALGFCNDIAALAEKLRGSNVLLVVDAAQLAAHSPIDVQAMGCDFLVCSAHKFYGPTGIGLVYGRAEYFAALPVWQGGGEMIEHVELTRSRFAPLPHRFEAGTSALAAIAGLEAVLDWWAQQDRVAMQAHEQDLQHYLHQGLSAIAGVALLSQAQGNIGIATLVPATGAGWQAADLAQALDEQDIAVRLGHHCAQPLMKLLGCDASLRLSLAAYNTRDELDRLFAAIAGFIAGPLAVPQVRRPLAEDDLTGLSLQLLLEQPQWQLRYKLLMQWSARIAAKPAIRQQQNLVHGCESSAWLAHSCVDGRHYFALDSDARIVKGLGVVLLLLVNGRTREQLAALDFAAQFAALGLERHLSASRSNGFRALLNRALDQVGLPPLPPA